MESTMFEEAIFIVKKLREHRFQAVFAGGFVRDTLLGIRYNDIDIATSALPDQIEKLFLKTVGIGKSFGVITIIMDKYSFEVATFRSDGEYLDGRRPSSVQFCSMKEDALRRDFTINGMFCDPISNKVIDYVKGLEDIVTQTIRFIGNPEDRIEEDRLRMLRAIRFAVRFDFDIEENTWKAIINNAHRIKDVSQERIRDELVKMLRYRKFDKTLNLLRTSNLLKEMIPELTALYGCEQASEWHPEGDVWIHTICALERLPECTDELIWGTLLHDIGKPETTIHHENGYISSKGHDKLGATIAENILKRLRLSNDFTEIVTYLVRYHMQVKDINKMKKSTFRKFINRPYIDDLIKLSLADSMACGLTELPEWYKTFEKRKEEFEDQEVVPPCLVNGKDLIDMGFKPGPLFKTILEAVLNEQFEERIKSKASALQYVKDAFLNK